MNVLRNLNILESIETIELVAANRSPHVSGLRRQQVCCGFGLSKCLEVRRAFWHGRLCERRVNNDVEPLLGLCLDQLLVVVLVDEVVDQQILLLLLLFLQLLVSFVDSFRITQVFLAIFDLIDILFR